MLLAAVAMAAAVVTGRDVGKAQFRRVILTALTASTCWSPRPGVARGAGGVNRLKYIFAEYNPCNRHQAVGPSGSAGARPVFGYNTQIAMGRMSARGFLEPFPLAEPARVCGSSAAV